MLTCRLIIDSPARGSWNMAVDEALLDSANRTSQPTLRIYRWAPATLSLGYFQSYAERLSHTASVACDVVRRRSGGGAIMHDDELTYSLVMPIGHPVACQPETLYKAVHQAVIRVLSRMEILAWLYDGPPSDGPFLCFERRSSGDVVVGEHKVLGSAQRRSKSAVLQHGSLLLRRSVFAPSLAGIFDLQATTRDIEPLACELSAEIGVEIRLSPIIGRLSRSELVFAENCESTRFAHRGWTQKR